MFRIGVMLGVFLFGCGLMSLTQGQVVTPFPDPSLLAPAAPGSLEVSFNLNCPANFTADGNQIISVPRAQVLQCGECAKLPGGVSSWEYSSSAVSSSVQVFLSTDCSGSSTSGRQNNSCQASSPSQQVYDLLASDGAADPAYGVNDTTFNDNIRSAQLTNAYCASVGLAPGPALSPALSAAFASAPAPVLPVVG